MNENLQRPVVCGTDFSEQAGKAADVAAAVSLRLGVPLLLIHGADELGELPSPYWKEISASFREQLHKEATRIRRTGARVEEILAGGAPEDGVATRAERANARLIILAASGNSSFIRWTIGSVSERIAESAWVPTLVLHETARIEDWARGGKSLRVFVGADFTVNSEAAINFAGQLLEIGPCDFTVGFVDNSARERAENLKHGEGEAPFNAEAEETLKHDLRNRALKYIPNDRLQVRVLPTMGQAESRLIDMASEAGADLMVIGTHQWHGVSRLRHRSVSRRILHTAPTSVILVPAPYGGSRGISQARRILVPTDLSPHSGAAIPHAFPSLQPGGTVWLFHVTMSEDDAPLKRKQLQELVPAEAMEHDFKVETEVAVDVDPAKAICAAADRLNVDLICMGSRSPQKRRNSLGLTTQGVLTQTTRPVLVVPQHSQVDL